MFFQSPKKKSRKRSSARAQQPASIATTGICSHSASQHICGGSGDADKQTNSITKKKENVIVVQQRRKSDRLSKRTRVPTYFPKKTASYGHNSTKRLKKTPPSKKEGTASAVKKVVAANISSKNSYTDDDDIRRQGIGASKQDDTPGKETAEQKQQQQRYHRIFRDLFGMFTSCRKVDHFLDYLQEHQVTDADLEHILQIQDSRHGFTLLHSAVRGCNGNHQYIQLVQRFIKADKSKSSVLIPTNVGLLPLHLACCNLRDLNPKNIQLLLDADPTKFKKSILYQSKNGILPLHCLCSGIQVQGLKETIRFLLDYDGGNGDKTKTQLLTTKTTRGQTVLDKAAHYSVKDKSKTPWLFPFLAQERIKSIQGPNVWRGRLQEMLHTLSTRPNITPGSANDENHDVPTNLEVTHNMDPETIGKIDKGRRRNYAISVVKFQILANNYDKAYEGIPWVELAIWKGRELPPKDNKNKRQERWLTCGSTTILKLVVQYL